jgi:electron transfer flavoprotein beta subunit
MKILVAVTQVATLAPDAAVEGATVPEADLTYARNEWDDYAVEFAVRTAEARSAETEVVVVTVGPARSEAAVEAALARGADRAIRVWDDALADAVAVGPRATARILAAVVEREAPDLTLTGAQTADDGHAATGVALAAERDLAWAAVVDDVDLDPDAGEASVRRELEDHVAELVTVPLPAVLTVQTGIVDRPLPADRQRDRSPADDATVDLRSLADLDLDPAVVDLDPAPVALARPDRTAEGTRFEGSPAETATHLADVLRDAGGIGE